MTFLTGVPGFLGTRLLRALAEQEPDTDFLLLVQPKFEAETHSLLTELALTGRAEVVPGDITAPDLALGSAYGEVAAQITGAFHLAAVYDLSVSEAVGWRVNVEGTRHVLDLLEQSPKLERFGYVSSAYVSGRRTGTIYEDELIHDAGFKNVYEETKYHAEVLVQERADEETLPTIVFRPSIVVGDSETGETDKFDGPYFVLDVLRRLPRVALVPRIGSGQAPVHLVPVDFVVQAMVHLTQTGQHTGSVFHLTDPEPLTAHAIMQTFTDLLDMKAVYVPVPPTAARLLMQVGLGRALGLTPELIDYFDHSSHYDRSNTEAALADTGIRCPPFPEYAPRMVEYMQQHEDVRSSAMY